MNDLRKIMFLLFLLSGFCNTNIHAQKKENSITLTFTNIRNSKGLLRLGVFKTQEEFESEKPYKKLSVRKDGMKNKSLSAVINLPNGTYGISVLDDENDNSKMDFNMVGIPKEGFAFSNYYHSGFSKPKMKEFTFTIVDGNIQITCKMRYI